MRKIVLLAVLNICAALAIVAQGAPQIIVSTTSLDFGDGYNGYNEYRTLVVTGVDLTDDISLTLQGASSIDYVIKSSKTITPEEAAEGAEVVISFFPMNEGPRWATLVFSSPGAQDAKVTLKGNGIKTSAFLIPDEKMMTFETAVMCPVYKTLVVHRSEFDGWLAVAPYNPFDPVFLNPKIAATLQGDSDFRLMGVTMCNKADSLVLTVRYRPLTVGVHTAQIILTGEKAHPVTVELEGTAYMPETGDVNGDGRIDIADVTSLIDLLLNNIDDDEEEEVGMPPYADANEDGIVGISDVTLLIDHMLTARE